MKKICIIGASGFVGRALVERLMANPDYELVAVIRSTGNAWSIIRHGIPLVQGDLSDPESVRNAVSGCDAVVNLALGDIDKMVSQLQGLVNVCKEKGVARLIHVSSITVYGDRPDSSAELEGGPVRAIRGSYGWQKQKQDLVIKRANERGLSSVVLCPPHVTGVYGRIFHQVVESIGKGTFALVDGGVHPCVLVDVSNLCQAIEKSIHLEESDGERIFVTNGDAYTWRDMAHDACRVAGVSLGDVPVITAEQLALTKSKPLSVAALLAGLIKLPEVKRLVKQSSLLENQTLLKISRVIYLRLRSRKLSHLSVGRSGTGLSKFNYDLCNQQLRGVRHRIDKAQAQLGYEPEVDSRGSFSKFEDYYKKLYGYDTEYWDLICKGQQ